MTGAPGLRDRVARRALAADALREAAGTRAFVHALDLRHGVAYCVDLPGQAVLRQAATYALRSASRRPNAARRQQSRSGCGDAHRPRHARGRAGRAFRHGRGSSTNFVELGRLAARRSRLLGGLHGCGRTTCAPAGARPVPVGHVGGFALHARRAHADGDLAVGPPASGSTRRREGGSRPRPGPRPPRSTSAISRTTSTMSRFALKTRSWRSAPLPRREDLARCPRARAREPSSRACGSIVAQRPADELRDRRRGSAGRSRGPSPAPRGRSARRATCSRWSGSGGRTGSPRRRSNCSQ